MKKVLLLIGILPVFFSFTPPNADLPLTTMPSRQCCTVTNTFADGSSVQITACAGWFLSNDAKAYAKACEKANGGLN